jgi:hypothetical protein
MFIITTKVLHWILLWTSTIQLKQHISPRSIILPLMSSHFNLHDNIADSEQTIKFLITLFSQFLFSVISVGILLTITFKIISFFRYRD